MQTLRESALMTYLYNKIEMREDGSRNGLDSYIGRARQVRLLTAEQERALGIRIAAGGPDGLAAQNKLVEANLRLVLRTAAFYARSGISLEDLIQEGNLGLIKAAEKFDATRGHRFSTYATYWIRQSITRHLRKNIKSTIISQGLERLSSQLKILERDFRNRHMREPSLEEMAAAMGMSLVEFTEFKQMTEGGDLSFDAPSGDEPGSPSLLERTSGGGESVETALLREEKRRQVLACVNAIPDERTRGIVKRRHGLGEGVDGDGLSLERIGREYRVTRERIRQIELGAYKRLRVALRSLE